MWQWHTRTWVDNGVVHQSIAVGVGWYLAMAIGLIVVLGLAWMADG